jgi:hypothetical protein
MEEQEYSYWEINYITCESNRGWTIARTPIDWDEYDLRSRIQLGGCGDDPATIEEIFESSDTNYSWDFCD